MAKSSQRVHLLLMMTTFGILILLAGCSNSNGMTENPPATTFLPVTDTTPPSPSTPSEQTGETAKLSPTSEADPTARSIGEYDNISFIVSSGSEATFTVEEQLVRLPLPNDAVLRTTALSGTVHLDGRVSTVQIDLQKLSSDQSFRDRYVRERMFGDYPIATFTVSEIGPVPAGLDSGEVVMTQVAGILEIRGNTFPLGFEIEARDDGDRIFIVGRTMFTWEQLNIPPPTARSVASIENEVRVEVLLTAVPQSK